MIQMTDKKLRMGARRGSAKQSAVIMVEGEAVTYETIADRVGCTAGQARTRIRKARARGSVTWEMLRR